MRLYLSSYRLGDASARLRPPPGGARAAIVLNALDALGARRADRWSTLVAGLEALGWECGELDLREYFDAPDALPGRLQECDLVWAVGGNAFTLARAMTAARFAGALETRRADPRFTYGGFSAGACVAGPDLAGIELMDDPDDAPEGYPDEGEARTLGLLPIRIVPHWRSDHPEAAAASAAAQELCRRGLTHRCLRDGQVLALDV